MLVREDFWHFDITLSPVTIEKVYQLHLSQREPFRVFSTEPGSQRAPVPTKAYKPCMVKVTSKSFILKHSVHWGDQFIYVSYS